MISIVLIDKSKTYWKLPVWTRAHDTIIIDQLVTETPWIYVHNFQITNGFEPFRLYDTQQLHDYIAMSSSIVFDLVFFLFQNEIIWIVHNFPKDHSEWITLGIILAGLCTLANTHSDCIQWLCRACLLCLIAVCDKIKIHLLLHPI